MPESADGNASSYQVLARKSRPQTFEALIGQEPIVTALRNALREDRIAQAYLFSGIRGVGKTTTARLFAKALNCERGQEEGPCNDCPTCQEITAGADLDVLEIDAATYSKVEQVRDLTESLKYGPARDRYKVVVLDEVHRLSRQAFDALLKIVEEPPAHLTFIFATTEVEAVPATILSRCQEFHFRRVDIKTLSAHLRALCASESIEASDASLRLIARAAEGSVRDAVALLDQLATYGGKSIDEEEAARLFGGLDTKLFQQILAALLKGEGATLTNSVAEIEDNGWDPRRIYSQLLAYCRSALHLAQGCDPDQLDLPAEEITRLSEIARESGYETLLRLVHHLLTSENLVRRSDAASLALEIALLRAAELPRLIGIESLLENPGALRGGGASDPQPSSSSPSSQSSAAPARPATPRATEAAPEPAPVTPSTSASAAQIVDRVSRERASLGAHLGTARLEIDDGVLTIRASDGDLVLEALKRERNHTVLESALREAGLSTKWRTVTAPLVDAPQDVDANADVPTRDTPDPPQATSSAASPAAPRAAAEPPADPAALSSVDAGQGVDQEVLDHPTVKAVLDVFGGQIRSIDYLEDAAGDGPS